MSIVLDPALPWSGCVITWREFLFTYTSLPVRVKRPIRTYVASFPCKSSECEFFIIQDPHHWTVADWHHRKHAHVVHELWLVQ